MRAGRRRAVSLLAGVVPAAALAQARPAGEARRIGYLTFGSRETAQAAPYLFEPIRRRLRELHWVEGSNIVSEYRFADRNEDRLHVLARELVASRVDLLVAMQTASAHAARKATRDIPIVFASSDLTNLVVNQARPEGNLTGVSNNGAAIAGKHLEIARSILPGASRAIALANPGNPSTPAFEKDAQSAARLLGLGLVVLAQRDPVEIERRIRAMTARPDALVVQNDVSFFLEMDRIIALAVALRLPAVYGAREFPLAGGLVSYGANLPALYAQLATYIDRILRGARPGDLPVAEPTEFELVVNAKTAKALGLTLPASLMLRVTERIE